MVAPYPQAQAANIDEAAGAWAQAQQYARRQLVLEPWREEAHRQLVRLLVRQGLRAAVIGQGRERDGQAGRQGVKLEHTGHVVPLLQE